ncbi:ABC transporter ATP-binding protein [Clostridium ganghwense]|uniref:ABC transporter ATP-binding protein n=1 Tax=Clostridium ganghwense TaxID=312089 RepID=A0ABT4CRM3_9CLOT|nr:ABC transporter ATP-binding protein [Clostridium ganghwense]MCY6371715.1 ABC transporter ATP-binding protein [Clostridium ganghwense]
MKNVLVAKNLKKIYGGKGNVYTALNGIDLEIEEGEFIGIMGPSGAGKTTLLNIISTIDKPTSGTVVIDNQDITKMKDKDLAKFRRESLGFIFQDFNLLDTLTIKENIALPLALAKVNNKELNKKVKKISKLLGIDNLLNKYPYEVSGGQKQRAAAARAIITRPSLVLADEPTGALDSRSSTELLEALSELNKNDKATIMMVTHDAFAASYCKKVLLIKDGVIYEEINRTSTRKAFFQEIMEMMSRIGGDNSAVI